MIKVDRTPQNHYHTDSYTDLVRCAVFLRERVFLISKMVNKSFCDVVTETIYLRQLDCLTRKGMQRYEKCRTKNYANLIKLGAKSKQEGV